MMTITYELHTHHVKRRPLMKYRYSQTAGIRWQLQI